MWKAKVLALAASVLGFVGQAFSQTNPYNTSEKTINVRIVSTSTVVGGNPTNTSSFVYNVNAINVSPLVGISSACTGTQIIQAPTISSGVVTGGSCAAQIGGGGGGSSTLAVTNGTAANPGVNISSPTAIVNFSNGSFGVSLQGSATAFITLDAVSLSTGVTGTLPVANGGTGDATLASGQIMYGSGTSAVSSDANSYVTSSSETFSGSSGIKVTNNVSLGTATFTGAGPFVVLTSSTGATSPLSYVGISTGDASTFYAAYTSSAAILASATNSSFTWITSNVWYSTLTANTNVWFPVSSVLPGERVLLILYQDATGSRTVAWDADIKWAGGTAPTLTTTGGQADIVSCVYGTWTSHFYCVPSLNFSP